MKSAKLCGLVAAVGLFAINTATATPYENFQLIGQQLIPTGTSFNGTTIGGLSGIDYNPATGQYIAISDDRSDNNPARFYTLSLGITQNSFSSVTFQSTTAMLQPNGTVFPSKAVNPTQTVDPEGIRINKQTGTLFWSSEGDKTVPVSPFVREMKADGTFVREFATPSTFNASPPADTSTGIRNNLAFESLALTPNGKTLFTATENGLYQDGPAADLTQGSPSRVLRFDVASGQANGQFVYMTDKVAATPNPANAFVTNGLVDFYAIDDKRLIAVEREFATGVGNSIRLYLADLSDATDVSGFDSIIGQTVQSIKKTLLIDLAAFGITLDNIEGITFGPMLANGDQVIVLVADNNFSGTQVTQFIALSATPVPEPSSLLLMVGALAAATAARRRGWRRPHAATA